MLYQNDKNKKDDRDKTWIQFAWRWFRPAIYSKAYKEIEGWFQ